MSYFKELPNIQYIANFPNQSFNTDTVDAKNIFRRAKIRGDIINAVTAFNYYQIKDNERPDQLAKKFYNDEELDWVILITNNIIDVTEQWPLDNDTLYKHLIDKYGSEEELLKLNRYVSEATRDEYNRLLIPGDLEVDKNSVYPNPFTTEEQENQYTLSSFPLIGDTQVNVNLNQIVPVFGRANPEEEVVNHLVTDITVSARYVGVSNSNLYIEKRDSNLVPITINNNLSSWASSWSGILPVLTRANTDINVSISDTIGPGNVAIPPYLYDVINIDGTPTFSFKPVTN